MTKEKHTMNTLVLNINTNTTLCAVDMYVCVGVYHRQNGGVRHHPPPPL